jgi:hypothetical protein
MRLHVRTFHLLLFCFCTWHIAFSFHSKITNMSALFNASEDFDRYIMVKTRWEQDENKLLFDELMMIFVLNYTNRPSYKLFVVAQWNSKVFRQRHYLTTNQPLDNFYSLNVNKTILGSTTLGRSTLIET